MTDTSHPKRRTPRQARSRERVQRILVAAAELIARHGVDALTMANVAQEAGVPVGTIYQFFAGKSELIQALAEQYAERALELLDGLSGRVSDDWSWEHVLDVAFSAYVAYYANTPGLRELWVFRRIEPEFLVHDHMHNNPKLAARLARILQTRATASPSQLELMMRCALEAGQALMEQAFRIDAGGDADLLGEARQMLVRYLTPAFATR